MLSKNFDYSFKDSNTKECRYNRIFIINKIPRIFFPIIQTSPWQRVVFLCFKYFLLLPDVLSSRKEFACLHSLPLSTTSKSHIRHEQKSCENVKKYTFKTFVLSSQITHVRWVGTHFGSGIMVCGTLW